MRRGLNMSQRLLRSRSAWVLGFLAVGLFSSAASAQTDQITWRGISIALKGWTTLGESNNYLWLYRSPVLRPPGALPRIWMRAELYPPDARDPTTLSGTTLDEVDCAQGRIRTLQEVKFPEHNLTGVSNGLSSKAGEWQFAVPGSTGDSEIKLVCK